MLLGHRQLSDASLKYFIGQFAEYGRTRRDLARAEPFFAPFSFNFLDISRACTCHTLQTGLLVCFLDVSLNASLNSSLFILSFPAQYFGSSTKLLATQN